MLKINKLVLVIQYLISLSLKTYLNSLLESWDSPYIYVYRLNLLLVSDLSDSPILILVSIDLTLI